MKVFLSWSSEHSKELAEALSEWLKLILQGTEPYVSSRNIRVGKVWFDELSKELATNGFGVLCLTAENLSEPWILFEAGALWKGLKGENFVIPLLFGVQPGDVKPPLGFFQATVFEKEKMKKLIEDMNKCLDNPVPEKQRDKSFEAFWPELLKNVTDINKKWSGKVVKETRTQDDKIEEMLGLVRTMARNPPTFGFARYSDPDFLKTSLEGLSPSAPIFAGLTGQPMGLLYGQLCTICQRYQKQLGQCSKCGRKVCTDCSKPDALSTALQLSPSVICNECVK